MKYLLIALFIGAAASAQDSTAVEAIQTDRPDQTETPALVPRGMFQMENGFSFEDAGNGNESIVAPSSLLKYGLNDNFELRLILE